MTEREAILFAFDCLARARAQVDDLFNTLGMLEGFEKMRRRTNGERPAGSQRHQELPEEVPGEGRRDEAEALGEGSDDFDLASRRIGAADIDEVFPPTSEDPAEGIHPAQRLAMKAMQSRHTSRTTKRKRRKFRGKSKKA